MRPIVVAILLVVLVALGWFLVRRSGNEPRDARDLARPSPASAEAAPGAAALRGVEPNARAPSAASDAEALNARPNEHGGWIEGRPALFEGGGANPYESDLGYRVEPGRTTDVGSVRVPGTASFEVRVLDARTEEPIPDVRFAVGFYADQRDTVAAIEPLSAPHHVAATIDVEITTEVRHVERTVDLARADGIRVTGLADTSRAREAGLRVGDVIVRYDAVRVHDLSELLAARDRTAPTDQVAVEVVREGRVVPLLVPGGRLGANVENARVNVP